MGALETLEFIIHPDGRVEERVTGVVGRSCAEVTAKIEEQLGRVVQQQPTSEFFTEVVQQSYTANTHSTDSAW